MFLPTVCLFLALLEGGRVLAALPSGWSACKKDSPDRNGCLQKAITQAFKLLLRGNKELGIPPFDPVVLGEISTKAPGHSLAPLTSEFHNFTVYNYQDMEVTKVELNGRNLKLQCKFAKGPETKSPYKMNGRVVAIHVFGEGDSYFKFVNTKITFDMTFKEKPVEKDGKNYYQVEKLKSQRSVDKMEISLSHLEDDDTEVGPAMIKHINCNWDVLWEDLKSPFEEALDKHHLNYANKIFSKIPIDDIVLF